MHVHMTVLHAALTQLVTKGPVIVCVYLDIKEKDARTVSVFVVIQGTNINLMHIILKIYLVILSIFFIEMNCVIFFYFIRW
jgi:hypothetical protein